MNSFSYAVAADVPNAVSELEASSSSKCIAGGTNFLDLMKENVARPSHLVDITRLPLLSKAILAGATAQIRNMATNGGNLLQRTSLLPLLRHRNGMQ